MFSETKSNLRRIVFGLILAVTGGFAFVLAFPPYEIWPLVLVGFVPVLVAQHRIMPPKLSSLATAVAIAIWLQGYLGPVFAPVGTFMVWLPLIAFALSFLTDRDQRIFHNVTKYRWFVISGIITWAGIEMIRLFLPVAGTWAFIAYPLYRQLWLIQPASIFGIIGTGMLVMLINHVLALQVIGWLDQKWPFFSSLSDTAVTPLQPIIYHRWAMIGGITVVAWLAISLGIFVGAADSPTVRVAAIQPAVSPIVSSNRGLDVEPIHSRMLEQTVEAANEGAQFIVWPEGSFNWDPQVEDRLNLAALAKEHAAYIVPGYVVVVGEEGFRNEATVINPEGQFLGVFGKDHPVVFGGETSLSRGSYPVYKTEIGNLATIICYDLDYTDTTRKMVARGAQLIGVPSNDWGSIADKHYTHVVFRAIENRVAMVKADGSYDSAIIDPYGRILELAVYPEGGEATLVADLPLGSGKGTVTTYLGDWLGWLALAGLVFFTFGSGWLKKMQGN
jgi:apolipoprotein N-acyltransferase